MSRVDTFLSNPFKHWCKYVAGYKEKHEPELHKYMDRGTIFHKMMEILSDKEGYSVSYAKEKVAELYKDSGFLDECFRGAFMAVDRYIEEYDYNPFKNVIETEYELNYKLPNGHDFIGYIDAIIDNGDGTVTLVDYKTYSTSPQEAEKKYSMQANMYMYVANQLGFNVRWFMFDCVNPKEKITGRNYKTKRLKFPYNEARVTEFFNHFVMLTDMIEQFQDYKLYRMENAMPDMYTMLFKVYTGEIAEDLDTFLHEHFIVPEES